jgi:alanine racemase
MLQRIICFKFCVIKTEDGISLRVHIHNRVIILWTLVSESETEKTAKAQQRTVEPQTDSLGNDYIWKKATFREVHLFESIIWKGERSLFNDLS